MTDAAYIRAEFNAACIATAKAHRRYQSFCQDIFDVRRRNDEEGERELQVLIDEAWDEYRYCAGTENGLRIALIAMGEM